MTIWISNDENNDCEKGEKCYLNCYITESNWKTRFGIRRNALIALH